MRPTCYSPIPFSAMYQAAGLVPEEGVKLLITEIPKRYPNATVESVWQDNRKARTPARASVKFILPDSDDPLNINGYVFNRAG